jgi:recombinational DNA repair protein RecR
MGDAAMSELPKRSCEICTDITTGEAQTVITVESSPPIMALAWVNFLKQRLHVLQVDYRHVTADRIVVESRPEAAESVAQLLRSAAECADDYVQGARSNMSARETQPQPAQFGEA